MPETSATSPSCSPMPPNGLWQPVPANGHIAVRMDPSLARMETKFGFGTQTVPPAAMCASTRMTATRS